MGELARCPQNGPISEGYARVCGCGPSEYLFDSTYLFMRGIFAGPRRIRLCNPESIKEISRSVKIPDVINTHRHPVCLS